MPNQSELSAICPSQVERTLRAGLMENDGWSKVAIEPEAGGIRSRSIVTR